jgi:hypothetical protein
MLSETKHLASPLGREILRYAQDDNDDCFSGNRAAVDYRRRES